MREKLDAANKQLEALNKRMDDLHLVQSPPPPAAAPQNATASTLAARPTPSHHISPTVPQLPLTGASSSAPAKTQPPKVAATNRPHVINSCDVCKCELRGNHYTLLGSSDRQSLCLTHFSGLNAKEWPRYRMVTPVRGANSISRGSLASAASRLRVTSTPPAGVASSTAANVLPCARAVAPQPQANAVTVRAKSEPWTGGRWEPNVMPATSNFAAPAKSTSPVAASVHAAAHPTAKDGASPSAPTDVSRVPTCQGRGGTGAAAAAEPVVSKIPPTTPSPTTTNEPSFAPTHSNDERCIPSTRQNLTPPMTPMHDPRASPTVEPPQIPTTPHRGSGRTARTSHGGRGGRSGASARGVDALAIGTALTRAVESASASTTDVSSSQQGTSASAAMDVDVDANGASSDAVSQLVPTRREKVRKQHADGDVSGLSSAPGGATDNSTLVVVEGSASAPGDGFGLGNPVAKVCAPGGNADGTSTLVLSLVKTVPITSTGTLRLTANFRLQHDRKYLHWPQKDHLLKPSTGSGLVIDATGTIKFVGGTRANNRCYYRWPLSGAEVLDTVAAALRKQLETWQSERTTAVRTRSKGVLPVPFSPSRAALQEAIGDWFESLCGASKGKGAREQWLAGMQEATAAAASQ